MKFLIQDWTVGRAIDEAANRARLKNENNIQGARVSHGAVGFGSKSIP